MENYIALLLLIVPGFIARSIFINLNQSRKAVDKFYLTIQALTFSIFIILLNYITLRVFGIIPFSTDFTSITKDFGNITFVIKYIIITIITSIYVGCFWNWFTPFYMFLINIIRNSDNKNTLLVAPSTSIACLDDGNHHLLSIEKDGSIIDTGFLDTFDNFDGNIKNISLGGQDIIGKINMSSYRIKKTYHFDDRKILEYDIDEFEEKKSKWRQKVKSLLTFISITIFSALCLYLSSRLFLLLHF